MSGLKPDIEVDGDIEEALRTVRQIICGADADPDQVEPVRESGPGGHDEAPAPISRKFAYSARRRPLTLIRSNGLPTRPAGAKLESDSEEAPELPGDVRPSWEATASTPRQMSSLLDSRVRVMGEGAWAAMKQIVRSAPNTDCSGALCYGPTIPDELIFNPPDSTVARMASASAYRATQQAAPASFQPQVRSQGAATPQSRTPIISGSAEVDTAHDDATADLLRPILRQWLAENMTNMLEKALHLESRSTGR